jgi:hypothetical protein
VLQDSRISLVRHVYPSLLPDIGYVDLDTFSSESRPLGHGGRGGALLPGVSMSSLSLHRKTLLFLLCAILAAPWATAAPQRSHPPQAIQAIAPAPLDLLGRSWSFLKSLWSEEGCMIDPDGRCGTRKAQAPQPSFLKNLRSEEGCRIDPDGRCLTGAPQAPQPRTDTGCMIDPSGRCHS